MVNDGFLLAGVAAGFAEFGGGAGGGQGFIDEHQWNVRNPFAQQIRKGADLGGGVPLAAVHAEWQAEHERANAPYFGKPGDALDGIRLRTVDGFHGMGEDAEVIGRGNADPGIAMIDAKGGMDG